MRTHAICRLCFAERPADALTVTADDLIVCRADAVPPGACFARRDLRDHLAYVVRTGAELHLEPDEVAALVPALAAGGWV